MDADVKYKLVVLGAAGVGKSSLIIQFVKQIFWEEYDPTVEDAYQTTLNLDGESIEVEILDTAGQEAFSMMRDDYIRNGEGFLLTYSLRRKDSFLDIPTLHRQIQRVKNTDQTPCVLVETMCDLAHSDKEEVTEGEGDTLAAQLQVPFVRTSAKHRINVDNCFKVLLRLTREVRKQVRAEEKAWNKGYCCVLV